MEGARKKNFSSEEIDILLSLVSEHADILENKTTDKVKPHQKEKTWQKIEDGFNAMCSDAKRSAKTLRIKYSNLKAEMKKRSADRKRSLYGTGGGPPMKEQCNDTDRLLRDLLPDNQVDGLKSVYDCDAENEKDCSDLLNDENFIEVVNTIDDEPQDQAEFEKEIWETYTPHQLKTKKSKKLCFEDDTKSKKTSWIKLAETKEKWTKQKLSQDIDIAKKEHDLRVAQMVEMHEIQKKYLAEKHEIEILILKKQLNSA